MNDLQISAISEIKGLFGTSNKKVTIDQMNKAVIQKVKTNNGCSIPKLVKKSL
ncbi:MAG: hypothetical protein RLZZ472_386 [Pseudomonadota bacterium]|jgi:hypothetical protein